MYKKLLILYVSLFLFIFLVKWFFDKNPGFWSSKYVSDNYSNIFGKLSSLFGRGHAPSNSTETISVGWHSAGEVVHFNSSQPASEPTGIAQGTIGCIEKIAGVSSSASRSIDTSQCVANNSYSISTKSLKTFLLHKGDGTLVYTGFISKWHTVTLRQFIGAWNVSTKLIIVVMLSSLLKITTSTSDLAYALEDILKPLKIIGLPSNEIALMIAIALRFSPSLLEESFRIIKAQASRGIDFQNGKIKDKIMAILSLFIPLFLVSFIKAGELSSALIARAYKPYECRTSHRIHKVSYSDYIICSIIFIFLSFLYTLCFNGGYMSFLGQLDYLLIIAK